VKQQKKRDQINKQIVKEALWADKFITILDQWGFGNDRVAPDVLEIGCAYGVIGKVIAQYYSGRAYGVEPNDSARHIAENITGVNIFAVNMDDVIAGSEEKRFDLVIFSHVLENITDPLSALKAARRLLKKDGLLLIDTPNNFVRKSWHIHHPYCYTRPSLEKILNKSGFKVNIAKEWSRPKYVVSPIYLTVLAQNCESDGHIAKRDSMAAFKNIVGGIVFNTFNRGPIGRLKYKIAGKKWKLSSIAEKEVNNIKSKLH
jgi:SAM-dependent methyltransferase